MVLSAPPRLLLVHAHPDDETIWTGGTIARYAAAGVHVTLVTCTLGEEGEIIPPGLAALAADQADQLGGFRVGELRAACAALGVNGHRFLGGMGRWRDSGMVDTAANTHPRAFVAGSLAEQTDTLAAILADVRPQVVITYGPDGGYGHPDHVRAHDITMAACAADAGVERVLHTVTSRAAVHSGVAALRELDARRGLPFQVPEPDELPSVPDELITTRVRVVEQRTATLRALLAHATQVSVWRGEQDEAAYALSNGMARHLPDEECYVLAAGTTPPDASTVDTDVFGGLAGSGDR